jgi:hypothetical protein
METNELTRLRVTVASRARHFGEDDPRTVAARHAYIDAKIAAHEAAIAELRQSRAELPDLAAA